MDNNDLIDIITTYNPVNEIDRVAINHALYYGMMSVFGISLFTFAVICMITLYKEHSSKGLTLAQSTILFRAFTIVASTIIIIGLSLIPIHIHNNHLYDQAVTLRDNTVCKQMSTTPRINDCMEANRKVASPYEDDPKLYLTKQEAQTPDIQLCLKLSSKQAAFECAKTLIQK